MLTLLFAQLEQMLEQWVISFTMKPWAGRKIPAVYEQSHRLFTRDAYQKKKNSTTMHSAVCTVMLLMQLSDLTLIHESRLPCMLQVDSVESCIFAPCLDMWDIFQEIFTYTSLKLATPSKYTHVYVQCSPASVGLAQAHPNNILSGCTIYTKWAEMALTDTERSPHNVHSKWLSICCYCENWGKYITAQK